MTISQAMGGEIRDCFLLPAIAETFQYFGMPVLGSTFDPLDYLMYVLGALLAVILDKQVLSRKFDFWMVLFLFASGLSGCQYVQNQTSLTSTPAISIPSPVLPAGSKVPTAAPPQPSPTLDLSEYAFPGSIDPAKQYMFYIHGRIIEEQGIPAISPDFGEYEYQAILEKLSGYDFVVLSEQRPKNTNSVEYARRITEQVMTLIEAGVPAKNITVVGASKGGYITIYVSHFLENAEINFVIMGICHPDEVESLKQGQIALSGNILSIYDSADDEFAGSCQELFSFSEGKGLSSHDEVALHVGTGHGILYKPLDEWIVPVVQWARKP